jgi:hypothetical protein
MWNMTMNEPSQPRLVYSGVGEGEGEAQKIGSGRVNPWQHFVLVEVFPKFMNKLIVCLPNCFHQIPWFFEPVVSPQLSPICVSYVNAFT